MITTSTTSPTDAESIDDVIRRAVAGGVTLAEIEALIVRARAGRDRSRCPECGAELAPLAVGIVGCLSCGIRVETRSIAATLELRDAQRTAEISTPVIDLALPNRVIEIAASFFHVRPPRRLLRPGRHRDICAARWVASWLLRQQGWTTLKIGRFFSIDHSTVIHGLRRVANDVTLRRVAHAAAELLAARSARAET